MEPLKIIHKKVTRWTPDGSVEEVGIDEVGTLQAIIDRSNEHTEKLNELIEKPKRFKAGEVIIKPIYEGMKDTYYMVGTVHSTEAEAQAALEKLTT